MRMMKVRSVGNRSHTLPLRASPSPTRLSLAIATALSGAATMHAAPALAADASAESSTLEEVVVTARKRTENLQDVPMSIDVFTSKDLQNLAISQFEDYVTMTPSLSFVSAGPGTQTLVMRGVSDGSNPNYSNTATTAFLVDDMSMNFGGITPDLHFYDIERIEVLNGPQGTTFGASAMAGALRFVTNKPDPSGFSAGADLDGGKIDGGTKNGTVEGFMNIPLIPDWTAIRFSAYRDYHGGYIDNINTTRNWVNGTVSNNAQWAGQNYNVERVTGGRFALGQKISDGWKATVTASYQKQLTHGAWDENQTIGGAIGADGGYVNGPPRSFGQKNVDRLRPGIQAVLHQNPGLPSRGGCRDWRPGLRQHLLGAGRHVGERVLGVHAIRQHGSAEQLHGRESRGFHVPHRSDVWRHTVRRLQRPDSVLQLHHENLPLVERTAVAIEREMEGGFIGCSAATGRERARTRTATTPYRVCKQRAPRSSITRRITAARHPSGPASGTATRRATITFK